MLAKWNGFVGGAIGGAAASVPVLLLLLFPLLPNDCWNTFCGAEVKLFPKSVDLPQPDNTVDDDDDGIVFDDI